MEHWTHHVYCLWPQATTNIGSTYCLCSLQSCTVCGPTTNRKYPPPMYCLWPLQQIGSTYCLWPLQPRTVCGPTTNRKYPTVCGHYAPLSTVAEKGRVANRGRRQTNFWAPNTRCAGHCVEHWRHMYCLWPTHYDEACQEFRGQVVPQIEAVHNLRKVRMYLNVLSLRSTS